ncbi:WcbI family polysaccharide biosynthesis putative acetyltransferase [Nitrospirillum bahiense]|uniref:Tetratricopeptide repeat protein n=1 Tax=Nitrospirillum amazonense TaxID=28077 RepID=A0A560FJ69_9PROT|nr:WcbI family polysaccharide biosynthesis putative acetyltransferase [Nitrospirillum amazonense]TWB21647.1 tetratricopeptide repeat protein [Nitrospirillum amazonense]
MPKKLVFYGNCQLQALAGLYARFVSCETADSVTFVDAFRPIEEGHLRAIEAADIIAGIAADFPLAMPLEALQHRADIILVPLVAARFLWPFGGSEAHPTEPPPPPGREAQLYPAEIGDVYLNKLIRDGVGPEEALERYNSMDLGKTRNLDRMLDLTMEKQRERDQKTGYGVSEIIEAHFRTEPLFLTPHHPGLRLSKYLALTFFQKVGASYNAILQANRYITKPTFPLDELPIHPSVASYFGMTYVTEDRRYQFQDEGAFTFSEYVRRYMTAARNDELQTGMHLVAVSPGRSIEILPNALERSPHSVRGHLALAEAFRLSGRHDDAVAASERAIALAPLNGDAHAAHAKLLMHVRRFEAVTESVKRAVELGCDAQKIFVSLVDIAKGLGELTVCLDLLTLALSVEPDDATLHLWMGWAQSENGSVKDAEREYRMAVALAPRHAAMRVRLASHLLHHCKAPLEALPHARLAVELDPSNIHFLAVLGNILADVGEFQESEVVLRRALGLSPKDAGLLRELSRSLEKAGRIEDALEAARGALEAAPLVALHHAYLGHFLARHNRFVEAEPLLSEALRLSPTDKAFENDLTDLKAKIARMTSVHLGGR